MKNLFIALLALSMVACKGGSGGAASTDNAKLPNVEDPSNPADPVDPVDPGSEQVTITTYSLAFTEAPVNGWPTKTYTAIGTCAQYEAKTYCWDDGLQVIDFTSGGFRYGPYNYSFFRLMESNGSPANCHGACTNDLLEIPTLIEGDVEAAISIARVTNVLANGTPEQATCTKTDDLLDCGDFSIQMGGQ